MSVRRITLIVAWIAAATAAHATLIQFQWFGFGVDRNFSTPGNWQGNTAPTNDGTAVINFNQEPNSHVNFSGAANVYSLNFIDAGLGDRKFKFTASSPTTLTLQDGIATASANTLYKITFSSDINLALANNQTWSLANSTSGQAPTLEIDGVISGGHQLTYNSNGASQSAVILKGHNTYSGGTILNGGSYSIYTSDAFGTGALTFNNAVTVNANNTLNVANAITLAGTSLTLRSFTAPFTLSGAITLAASTTLATQLNYTTQPVIISGNIGESGGARTLTKQGSGNLFLTGTNTYTGGTTISQGAVIFNDAAAIPDTGLISVGGTSYAGVIATNVTNFASIFSSNTLSTATGAIGLDTLPGNATATFSGAIDLSVSGANLSSISLGTATSAILTGTITPNGADYRFGGASGGTLTVQSNLTGSRKLQLNAGAGAMKLILQGSNTYSNGTQVNGAFLVFDGADAIPASGSLVASTTASYIGQTENTRLSVASFLAKFNAASTQGVVGFDSATPRTLSDDIDLSNFGSTAAIGTSTSITLTGILTKPTSSGSLRLVTTDGGSLTVGSTLATGSVLLAGNSSSRQGTITLTGNNSYSGGTTLVSSFKLIAGHANAFGTGAITMSASTNGSSVAFETAGNYTLSNAIVLSANNNNNLTFGGTNDFTLSGVISGGNSTGVLTKSGTNTVSLSGANTFIGYLDITEGLLKFLNDSASGMSELSLSGGNVEFTTSSPRVYGIDGGSGSVTLAARSTLTIDTSKEDYEFGGVITGNSSDIVITGGNSQSFGGANTGIASTTVVNGAAFAKNDLAFGTGMITVNATGGGSFAALGMSRGITVANPLTLTSGILLGFGTFSPTNGAPTIGANITLAPGAALAGLSPGKLSFGTGLILASGGTYQWGVQDADPINGTYSSIDVAGAVTFTATALSPFTFKLNSYNVLGDAGGTLNFDFNSSYTWTLLNASGGISGFDPNAISLDVSGFSAYNSLGTGSFSITQSGNNLLLNFSPVPEPSTYVLMALGSLLLAVRSRRKKV